ncbi:DUF523 domain-containing protein [Endozoicomonas sp. SM1973]|uniref:DUF523 domain-containing protein n=1 Tax=Spartinivicinus marinus TaxID=2994442 RepID=A0A853I4Z5_9GAMM|nr:DUF523 domain-containing protein [Spartinivicinus marinus]MCX4027660.1 DUF523 domain-containing protein [Spartinivicinus marinus]NYZ66642.1 DUF523 domain-containing protein [Spartinivicinus marinus]
MTQKVLISSCLLGEKVRYNGSHCLITHPIIKEWHQHNLIIAFCPEVAGGLPIPRPAAEISGGAGKDVWERGAEVIIKPLVDTNANDAISPDVIVTQAFKAGAEQCLALVHQHQIKLAILKAKSPSCGSETIYDGSFSGKLRVGEGVTTALLVKYGVKVFSELQLKQAYEYWLGL